MSRKNMLMSIITTAVALALTLGAASCSAQLVPAQVYVISVDGTVELGLSQYVLRGLKQAQQDRAAVILEINTFGGRVDAAVEIRDYILRMETPVIAFVRERAISAGALIAIASPQIAMAPGSTLGAAEPRPLDPKNVSYMRAEFSATAQRHGRDPNIAAAMVDADIVVDGLVRPGQLLTLTAQDALKYGYADLLTNYRTEVLAHYQLDHLPVVEIERNWAERLAGFVTDPTVSQILLIIGFLGIIIELLSPGLGLPGVIGVMAMGLFFGGRILAGLAGLEVVALFVLGIIMLIAEIFFIPGFGLVGVLGLISILASIFLSFDNFTAALTSLAITLAVTIAIIVLLWKRFTRSRAWSRFVLLTREERSLGYQGVRDYSELLGQTGVTVSALRPAGIVKIGDQRYDVVSDGDFIPNDTKVKVVYVEGNRIVVTEVRDK
ncbi:MAG: NfeD family protein [Limnochordia bacterium]|jgi:membrane-bound serine protease (ClpP class)|nr:NfeD family protein [Bacillota bacterium]NLH30839.1 nodulation protein NfeD [Bacillota bacterium]